MQSQHRSVRVPCVRAGPHTIWRLRPGSACACGRPRASGRGALERMCARRSAQRRAALPPPTARPACPSSSPGLPTPAAPRPPPGTCTQCRRLKTVSQFLCTCQQRLDEEGGYEDTEAFNMHSSLCNQECRAGWSIRTSCLRERCMGKLARQHGCTVGACSPDSLIGAQGFRGGPMQRDGAPQLQRILHRLAGALRQHMMQHMRATKALAKCWLFSTLMPTSGQQSCCTLHSPTNAQLLHRLTFVNAP